MLLRLAYLTVADTSAAFRLFLMTDREQDAEIPVLRHKITVLERQLAGTRARATAPNRPLPAALLYGCLPGRCGGYGYRPGRTRCYVGTAT
ncbi:hypothetical protein GCM10010182_46240 [Actinomadura cremea]|nr:hypothetical protein GCM10010182_46240 [Actinomadura cremea]